MFSDSVCAVLWHFLFGFLVCCVVDSKSINKGIGVDNMHYLNDGLWKVLTPSCIESIKGFMELKFIKLVLHVCLQMERLDWGTKSNVMCESLWKRSPFYVSLNLWSFCPDLNLSICFQIVDVLFLRESINLLAKG